MTEDNKKEGVLEESETVKITEEKIETPVENTPVEKSSLEDVKETVVVPSQATEGSSNEKTVSDETAKNFLKHQKKMIWVMIATALLVLIGALGLYLKGNKKSIFIRATEKLESNVTSLYEPLRGVLVKPEGDYTARGSLKMNITSDYLEALAGTSDDIDVMNALLAALNQTTHTYQYQLDETNQKFQMDWNSQLNGQDWLSFQFINQDKKGYVFLKGIYESYLEVGEVNIFDAIEEATDLEEQEYLYEFIVDSIKKNMKNEYFIKDTKKITLNGKEQKVNRVALVLDTHNLSSIIVDVVKDVKKDKKANELMEKLVPDFKDYEPKVEKNEKGDPEVLFSVYTKGMMSKAVQYELSMTSSVTDYDNFDYNKAQYATKMETTKIIYSLDEKEEIKIVQDKKTLAQAEIVRDKNGFTMTLKDGKGNSVGSLISKKEGKKVTYTGTLKADGAEFKVVFALENKKENEVAQTFDLQLKAEDMNLFSLRMDGTTAVKKGAKIDGTVVKNAVNIETLPEEELMKIQTGLQQKILSIFFAGETA